MLEIQYIGEHLWPGNYGHALLLLSFCSSLLGLYSFSKAQNETESASSAGWLRIARSSWIIHVTTLFIAIGLVFFIMSQRWYEYSYVFGHVNDKLSMRYILSAFWEGQEGSFMLWLFWHAVLGSVFLWTKQVLYKPVLAVFCLIQAFLLSMIIGVHIPIPFTDAYAKIGSSPFTLLREVMDIPLFQRSDYLSQLDGQGLNALLQNYWMTIHPPTLFLGFASMIIPFAYAIAGLWTGDHKTWLKPGLRWSLFGAGFLGIGILMGAAWAYEALSFGGYWSWDPVENTSLVPWLLLIAGIHVNLVALKTGHGLRAAYFFYLLTFISTLYSTFLTRSGILGDSSAHAFTEMGLEWQLVAFLVTTLGLAAFWFIKRYSSVPAPDKEEEFSSKEFWIYIGALTLLMSSVLISFTTSIPVYNKIGDLFGFDWQFSEPADREAHHNQFQIWIAILIGLLSGLAQFLRFRERNWSSYKSRFVKQMFYALLISAALTVLANLLILNFTYWVHLIALFAGMYTVVSNLQILIVMSRNNSALVSSAVSHVGFGIFLIGILVSGINKKYISTNEFAQMGLVQDADLDKSITLLKDLPMFMSDFWVTYKGDTLVKNKRTYHLTMEKRDKQDQITQKYDIYPYILYTNDMNELASTNPYTKRYLTKDIFSTIRALPQSVQGRKAAQEFEENLDYEKYQLGVGDTLALGDYYIVAESIDYEATLDAKVQMQNDQVISVDLAILDSLQNKVNEVKTGILRRDAFVFDYPDQAQKERFRFKLTQQVLRDAFPNAQSLQYDTLAFQRGESKEWQNYTVSLSQISADSSIKAENHKEGDLPVQASLVFEKNGKRTILRPIFILRDGRIMSPLAYSAEERINARFISIDPEENQLQFALASSPELRSIDILVAQDAERTDLLVLETIIFPGINLIWLGGLMMMIGLLVGFFKKIRARTQVA